MHTGYNFNADLTSAASIQNSNHLLATRGKLKVVEPHGLAWLSVGKALRVVGPASAKVREGMDKSSKRVGALAAGSLTIVQAVAEASDGTIRVQIGEHRWISAVSKLGVQLLSS